MMARARNNIDNDLSGRIGGFLLLDFKGIASGRFFKKLVIAIKYYSWTR